MVLVMSLYIYICSLRNYGSMGQCLISETEKIMDCSFSFIYKIMRFFIFGCVFWQGRFSL